MAWVLALGVVAACGPKVLLDEETDAGETVPLDTEAGDTVASTANPSTSSSPTTGATTASTGTTSGGPVPTTENPSDPTMSGTVGTVSTSAGTTGPGDGPDGEQCMLDAECMSGFCYVVGILGGVCGECNSDDDCPTGGCSPPNPLTGQGSVCNDGNYGEGCDSDDVCVGSLVCATIIDIPGIITESTCSQCRTDADCPGYCSPEYDIPNFTGAWRCVAPLEVPIGEGCDHTGTGDLACSTGICAAADIMGILEIGVCSECETAGDCLFGEMCQGAGVDLDVGLTPGTCV
jgi:hypothetical protein